MNLAELPAANFCGYSYLHLPECSAPAILAKYYSIIAKVSGYVAPDIESAPQICISHLLAALSVLVVALTVIPKGLKEMHTKAPVGDWPMGSLSDPDYSTRKTK